MASDARTVALEYQKAFQKKDLDKARSYLHDRGVFAGPLNSFETADTFVKEMSTFMHIAKDDGVRIKKVLADATDVCILWEYETVIPSIPVTSMSQWVRVEDGKIREFRVHFNPVPFISAKEKGHIAEALKSRK